MRRSGKSNEVELYVVYFQCLGLFIVIVTMKRSRDLTTDGAYQ